MVEKKELGSEYTTPMGYTYVKIGERKRQLKTRTIVESILHRQLLPEEKVYFRDRNNQNFEVDNLVLINVKTKDKIVFDKNNLEVHYLSSVPTWSLLQDTCTQCNKSSFQYAGKGLCRNCYQKKYRTKKLNTF